MSSLSDPDGGKDIPKSATDTPPIADGSGSTAAAVGSVAPADGAAISDKLGGGTPPTVFDSATTTAATTTTDDAAVPTTPASVDTGLADALERIRFNTSSVGAAAGAGATEAPPAYINVPAGTNFDSLRSLHVNAGLLKTIAEDMPYMTKPSAIQWRVMNVPGIITEGKSIIAQAQTGSGKTLAFGMVALSRINFNLPGVQVVIVLAARELAQQVATDIESYCKCMEPRPVVQRVLAGMSFGRSQGPFTAQIAVGTLGSLKANKGLLGLGKLRMLVLDEADQLIRDSIADLNDIKSACPPTCQKLLFSATFHDKIRSDCRTFIGSPAAEEIAVPVSDTILENIVQIRMKVKPGAKLEALAILVKMLEAGDSNSQCIAFFPTRKGTDETAEWLHKQNHSVAVLHGDVGKTNYSTKAEVGQKRDEVLADFRKGPAGGGAKFLVCTDVIARGIDISAVALVVNFSVPKRGFGRDEEVDPEQYVHRIGRTGRYGNKGVAVTLIETQQDEDDMLKVERYFRNGSAAASGSARMTTLCDATEEAIRMISEKVKERKTTDKRR